MDDVPYSGSSASSRATASPCDLCESIEGSTRDISSGKKRADVIFSQDPPRISPQDQIDRQSSRSKWASIPTDYKIKPTDVLSITTPGSTIGIQRSSHSIAGAQSRSTTRFTPSCAGVGGISTSRFIRGDVLWRSGGRIVLLFAGVRSWLCVCEQIREQTK